ncbi:glutathione S-transferase N-terminal domain-containing protein [Sphingorhabdus sp. Alg231-15]|uniref:glutathione S-transferase N-terminal domain-containing protein n=1 Tax=Sphingorhabdus sp. Alg231-15 TaxID=1922222 RepID=UPI000D5628F1
MTDKPILYSFRRCPYAMRARMALMTSLTPVRLREVVLRDKPDEMIAASPKATVPVLVQDDGTIIDESLAIMHWALDRSDPAGWLEDADAGADLIAEADSDFKDNLDRYKYPTRYDNVDPIAHRSAGLTFLEKLEKPLAAEGQLLGKQPRLADFAIFPFIRQFANNDRNWFDAQSLPGLQTWLAAHLGSDLFANAMKKYPQWKTGDIEPVFAG